MSQNKKLIFVYNADSSPFNQVGDLIHKKVSPKTYQCNLCNLTYSGVSMKSDWKEFINSLPIKAEFLHKDEFLKQFPEGKQTTFPAVFIKEDNSIRKLVLANEINRTKNLEDLKKLIQEKVKL